MARVGASFRTQRTAVPRSVPHRFRRRAELTLQIRFERADVHAHPVNISPPFETRRCQVAHVSLIMPTERLRQAVSPMTLRAQRGERIFAHTQRCVQRIPIHIADSSLQQVEHA